MSTPEQQPTLYLIAHKVRGEPAFDIATQIEIGNETGWIIPTSGHRAYPYWFQELLDCGVSQLPNGCWAYGIDPIYLECKGLIPIPDDDWPDHYPTRASPSTSTDLLAALGLTKPKASTIIRR